MLRTAIFILLTGSVNAQERIARTDLEKLSARHFNEAIEAFGAGDYEKSIPLLLSGSKSYSY